MPQRRVFSPPPDDDLVGAIIDSKPLAPAPPSAPTMPRAGPTPARIPEPAKPLTAALPNTPASEPQPSPATPLAIPRRRGRPAAHPESVPTYFVQVIVPEDAMVRLRNQIEETGKTRTAIITDLLLQLPEPPKELYERHCNALRRAEENRRREAAKRRATTDAGQ